MATENSGKSWTQQDNTEDSQVKVTQAEVSLKMTKKLEKWIINLSISWKETERIVTSRTQKCKPEMMGFHAEEMWNLSSVQETWREWDQQE